MTSARRLLPFAIAAALLLGGVSAPAIEAPKPAARTILLVRHGHYVPDPNDSSPGPGLSPLGVAQARLAGARLAALPPFDAFSTSPMTRAHETARVIASGLKGPAIEIVPEIAECTPPTRRREITEREKPEEMAACKARLDAFFARRFVPAAGAARRELIVAHGNVIRSLIVRALGVDPEAWLEMSIGHASITEVLVEADGRFKVISAGDTGHIPPNLLTGMTGVADKSLLVPAAETTDLAGAWKHVREDGTVGAWIVSDRHFSIAWYRKDPSKFVSTEGGAWVRNDDGSVTLTYEFDTAAPDRVGTSRTITPAKSGAGITADGMAWTRIDDGKPGALQGSWLMTGRKRDGQISTRTPGARRTMKILSGTRFQWIAYNVETKEFFGSGGGTYTTSGGKYTENLEFFSRDDARAGRSLQFEFQFVDEAWHHLGKSTAGEPMHEVWSRRKDLGI